MANDGRKKKVRPVPATCRAFDRKRASIQVLPLIAEAIDRADPKELALNQAPRSVNGRVSGAGTTVWRDGATTGFRVPTVAARSKMVATSHDSTQGCTDASLSELIEPLRAACSRSRRNCRRIIMNPKTPMMLTTTQMRNTNETLSCAFSHSYSA